MKAKEAAEKIYFTQAENGTHYYTEGVPSERNHIEYIRTDVFIEKAKGWFENRPEQYDANGVRCYSTEDFEDFLKAMKL